MTAVSKLFSRATQRSHCIRNWITHIWRHIVHENRTFRAFSCVSGMWTSGFIKSKLHDILAPELFVVRQIVLYRHPATENRLQFYFISIRKSDLMQMSRRPSLCRTGHAEAQQSERKLVDMGVRQRWLLLKCWKRFAVDINASKHPAACLMCTCRTLRCSAIFLHSNVSLVPNLKIWMRMAFRTFFCSERRRWDLPIATRLLLAASIFTVSFFSIWWFLFYIFHSPSTFDE